VTRPLIDAVHHVAPSRDTPRLRLVMLPGYGMARDDFARNGFIAAIHERGWPVDIVAAQPDVGLYLDGSVAAALHDDVVLPAGRDGAPLWFLGVSLGAMGALLYARRHPGRVAGVILLAPFLGTPGLIAEVADAGGLTRWDPGELRPVDAERQVLAWLKAIRPAGLDGPALYLGYGRDDRFARGASLLARELPDTRVIVSEGAHDWPTWQGLWRRILDRDPFGGATQRAREPTD
jgi:pimeloyl-ACP methyl ester carboxylesterase